MIVSDKPQTTRERVRMILTTEDAQLIFYDTPGLHKPLHQLGKEMNKVARSTIPLVDLVLWLVDSTQLAGKGDQWVAEVLKNSKVDVLVAFNKIDLKPDFNPEEFLSKVGVEEWPWVKISALKGKGLSELLEKMKSMLPVGPQYYPEGMLTDRSETFIISEFIREEILNLTEQEVPHSTAVVIEEIEERLNGKIYIRAIILVERDSQKKIIIGKGGSLLKRIGKESRKKVEVFLGKPIYLDLWVKTKKDWRNSLSVLRELGYTETEQSK